MRDDRHARHRRAETDRRRRPADGFRTRDARRFDRLVGDAVAGLPAGLLDYVDRLEVAVAEVPPDDADGEVAWSRLDVVTGGRERRQPADREPPEGRVVLYRRPLESRATSKAELADLVREAVVEQVAERFGIDDDHLDELGWA